MAYHFLVVVSYSEVVPPHAMEKYKINNFEIESMFFKMHTTNYTTLLIWDKLILSNLRLLAKMISKL